MDANYSLATFDKDELKEVFNFKNDKYCLTFKPEENQLSALIPNEECVLDEDMGKYVSFLKVETETKE